MLKLLVAMLGELQKRYDLTRWVDFLGRVNTYVKIMWPISK